MLRWLADASGAPAWKVRRLGARRIHAALASSFVDPGSAAAAAAAAASSQESPPAAVGDSPDKWALMVQEVVTTCGGAVGASQHNSRLTQTGLRIDSLWPLLHLQHHHSHVSNKCDSWCVFVRSVWCVQCAAAHCTVQSATATLAHAQLFRLRLCFVETYKLSKLTFVKVRTWHRCFMQHCIAAAFLTTPCPFVCCLACSLGQQSKHGGDEEGT